MDFGLLVRVGLLFARPGMLIMSAPVFGGHFAPTHVRIGLAFLVTIMLMPVVDVPNVVSITALGLVLARELAIGLAFSLSLRALISGAELGGPLTGSQLMLSYGSTIDPQGGVRSTVIATLFGNLTLLTFFAVNGHHALLRGLTSSYVALPMGMGGVDDSLVRGVMQLLGVVFVFGLRLAARVPRAGVHGERQRCVVHEALQRDRRRVRGRHRSAVELGGRRRAVLEQCRDVRVVRARKRGDTLASVGGGRSRCRRDGERREAACNELLHRRWSFRLGDIRCAQRVPESCADGVLFVRIR